jgi:hypothetical protein
MQAMMQNQFRAKTSIYWAQFVVCGGLGLFGVIFGALFWTGLLTDVKGDVRPDAGPPMVTIGSCLLAVGVLAAFNLVNCIPPLIRCYREGIECNVICATSSDGVPRVRGLVRVAWTILRLQRFRAQRLRIRWPEFRGAQVSGIPMAYVLLLKGAFTNPKTGRVIYGVEFTQVALDDDLEDVADEINQIAADPDWRAQLSSWSTSPGGEAAQRDVTPHSGVSVTAAGRSGKGKLVASFTWTKRDFVAAQRALPAIHRSGCISRVVRTGWFLFLHLVVLFGAVIAYRFISGNYSKEFEITAAEFGFFTLISLAALYTLYRNWYGVRWRLARSFHSLKLDQIKMTFEFDHEWIEVSSNAAQSRFAWSSVDWFAEFRDGFQFVTGNTGHWVPRSAFAEPSDAIELAEMAKERAGRFEFVDKFAAS